MWPSCCHYMRLQSLQCSVSPKDKFLNLSMSVKVHHHGCSINIFLWWGPGYLLPYMVSCTHPQILKGLGDFIFFLFIFLLTVEIFSNTPGKPFSHFRHAHRLTSSMKPFPSLFPSVLCNVWGSHYLLCIMLHSTFSAAIMSYITLYLVNSYYAHVCINYITET